MSWRPLKFKTVKELQTKIDEYFESCFEIQEDWKKKKIKPFTILWLCNFLDVDRKTLINYENKDDILFHTIKRAKSKVEEDIELWALTNSLNPTSAIFNLKNNFGWVEKIENENKNENLNIDWNEILDDNQKSLIANRYGNNKTTRE